MTNTDKYYVDGRGNNLQGPMSLDEARERAAKLGNPKGKNVDGVRIFALHETVRANNDEDLHPDYKQWLPDQANDNAREKDK